jgi:hypothetical protein
MSVGAEGEPIGMHNPRSARLQTMSEHRGKTDPDSDLEPAPDDGTEADDGTWD